MKIFYFVIIFISLLSCKTSSEIKAPDSIHIEFTGFKGDFYKKYPLSIDVVSEPLISQIDSLFTLSSKKYYCNIRPVAWQANVYYKRKEAQNYVFTVNSNIEDKLNIINGNKCFENKEIIKLISDLINIEAIREFDGTLNQEKYSKLVKQGSF